MSTENFIDINDLGLVEEPLGEDFNPSANAFSGPPPLPKGKYTVNIAFREQDPSKQFQEREYKTDRGHEAGKYFSTKLVGIVARPEENKGRRVFDDFVSTGIWRDDTSAIASILHLLGRGEEVVAIARRGEGQLALCRLLSQTLAANPLIGMSIDWEGRVKNPETGQYDNLYSTMTEFRQRDDGSYDPQIKDVEGNVIGVARLKVKNYFAAAGAVAQAG